MFASAFFTVIILYCVMRFLGVPLESEIVMTFSPASIHPDCFAFSNNLSLNRLMYFDSTLNIFESFVILLLKSFIPVFEV